MNIPGKAVSMALILFGLGWLITLFFKPNTWVTRSANQVNGTVQTGVGTQNFAPKNAAPLANGNKSTLDQTAIAPQNTQQQRVQQAPQTINSPNQAAQPNPSPTATVPASPQPTFEPSPAVVVAPSPQVVAEPVRAGW
jgi:hypothetical protein